MSERKLVSKLAEVMKRVKYIQKAGFNDFHRYKYATEADVNEQVREVLAELNVIMIPNVKNHSYREHINKNGKVEYIVTVEVEFTFYDGDTGETISFTTFGEGQDSGDKGTYKAITGAQKYALMKAFMIPTGDDPEGDSGVDERNKDNQNRQTIPASLKAKYQLGKGSLDGFEEWVTDQTAKGRSYAEMERILMNAMKKKEEQASA
jgi:predicted  nucleic acid-binding Zn-ribbon protein